MQSYGNTWGFPKGKQEVGETTEECAIREVGGVVGCLELLLAMLAHFCLIVCESVSSDCFC